MGAAACAECHGALPAISGLPADAVGVGRRAAWRSILHGLFVATLCHQAFMVPAVHASDIDGGAATAGSLTTELFARFDVLAARGMALLHRETLDPLQEAVALYLTHADIGNGHVSRLPVQVAGGVAVLVLMNNWDADR